MKTKRDGEELIKVGYRLPPNLIKRIEESAIANRRSINDEVIVILEKALSTEEKIEDFDKRLGLLEKRLASTI